MTDIQARIDNLFRSPAFCGRIMRGNEIVEAREEVEAIIKELQAQLSAKDALIAELQKENEWQDIETAPKVDGERIYAIDDRGCEYIVRWTDMPIGGYFDAPHLHTKLTHWRKLPEPPKGI